MEAHLLPGKIGNCLSCLSGQHRLDENRNTFALVLLNSHLCVNDSIDPDTLGWGELEKRRDKKL